MSTLQVNRIIPLTGDSVYIQGAVIDSASFALTASYVLNAVSASRAASALNASTASYVLNAVSASRATSAADADTATLATNATSASYAVSASYATSATVFPYTGSAVISGSLQVTGSQTITGSLDVAGNTTMTGSLTVTGTTQVSGSLGVTGSNFISGSLGVTGSSSVSGSLTLSGTQSITGSLNITGSSISLTLDTIYDGNSVIAPGNRIIMNNNSNTFGIGDLVVRGNSANVILSGNNVQATGSLLLLNGATGSLLGTASFADTASTVITAPSYVATTGSNTFTGTQYISNNTNATSFGSTAALYTDGGLRVTKDALISGSLFVAGNLTVFGTSSVNYITSSTLVGLEFINLNTDLPALRFAGINVGDSGSAAGVSSSFWYDSAKDNWLYLYAPAGSTQVTSSMAISGPILYNNPGNEQGLTANYLTKAQLVTADNNHHITSSQIFDDGTTVAIAGSLQVTGSLFAGNLTGSLDGSNLVNATVANAKLTNSTISGIALGSNLATLTIGTGLSGTSYNGSTGVTIANTGVTSNAAGTGVSVSGATGAVTISIGQAVATSSNVQFNSLGVGTAGSGTTGEIRATADVTAFYSSDERLKENITPIENPIEKLMAINGVTFDWKEGFDEIHSHKGADTGVIAQEIEAIGLPETVTTRENGFKAVKYEKLNALLIEGFKVQQTLIHSQQSQIDELKVLVNQLLNK